jgi:hypothetical protein
MKDHENKIMKVKRVFKSYGKTYKCLMSTHASVLVDSVGPPNADVYRAAASFP